MIKLTGPHRDRLPVAIVMALQAIGAESSLVLILMAGRTSLRNTEEALTQILDSDFCALCWRNMVGRMAPIAG